MTRRDWLWAFMLLLWGASATMTLVVNQRLHESNNMLLQNNDRLNRVLEGYRKAYVEEIQLSPRDRLRRWLQDNR